MWSLFKKNNSSSVQKRKLVSIRLEAIGGQGANSAGKILAETAVLGHGYSGNHFSSFGSEKRGAPVRSFVRFSPENLPIRSASFIKNPDLLIIFHASLIESHPEILDGVTENTDVVINSELNSKNFIFPVGFKARTISTVPATEIAMKNQCGLNVVMMGALCHLLPEIDSEILKKNILSFFGKLSIKVLEKNKLGFELGFKKNETEVFSPHQSTREIGTGVLPEMGWLNAPIGGVILNPGNSVLKDNSSSRKGVAPQLSKEICFNCGFCDMVCPDFCFVWDIDPTGKRQPELKGIDYQYCKGCQKCITVCPVEALKPVEESKIPESEKQNKLFFDHGTENVRELWSEKNWGHFVEHLSEKDQMLSPQTELLNPNSYLRAALENTEEWKIHLTEDMKKKLTELKK